jgi:hypothetical protein
MVNLIPHGTPLRLLSLSNNYRSPQGRPKQNCVWETSKQTFRSRNQTPLHQQTKGSRMKKLINWIKSALKTKPAQELEVLVEEVIKSKLPKA